MIRTGSPSWRWCQTGGCCSCIGTRVVRRIPIVWDLVGGHVEPGEQPEGAAVRECREEVGVEVGELRPIAWTVRDPALEVHAYAALRWVGEPRNLAPREHDDLRWFGREELAGLRMAHPGTLGDLLRVVEEGP